MPYATCIECNRAFNLADEDDAAEWAYGHDCEDFGETS
jgi:hypothetical protein